MPKLEIRAPMPGVFYRRPSPDTPPFKADGDPLSPGEVVGLIEVMKSFHEVKAEVGGAALAFLAEDGDAIMAGQVLAEVED
ncbi:acetyl-CoA carboxylase [Aureimonas populi]|uniref:Biotin carboxyl carrier protein of acetyl-CoA carboxylase n=1 Tax=Aureimonas populi TaxID=1701758 RepID=A0ABW5CTI5_9HYPH|nr:acetyl-CoA carboxylase [Aureimonas populi]